MIDVFIMDIPKWMREDFKVESDKAKARLTEFYAKDNKTTPVIYGIVLEVYSPDFKNPKDGINQIDKDQINPLTEALQNSGVPADEIRENLDRASQGNEWNDLKDKYERAQEISKETVKSLHTKIDNYLKK